MARHTKKKRRQAPNEKKRNGRGEVTTDITEIQKDIREYYEQLHVNKVDNLEAISKFLETYSPSKLNQEETDYLNRLITGSKRESVILKTPCKQKSRTI